MAELDLHLCTDGDATKAVGPRFPVMPPLPNIAARIESAIFKSP
jgi:hypothetical protein